MSRDADWRDANIRIRRICAEAYVTYMREHNYSQRWRAWEKMTVPLTLDENLLTQPGMTKETEAVVCAAPTALELLHKYALIKSEQRKADAARERGETPPVDYRILFRDRVLRGEESKPPDDPPEWAEYRKMKEAEVRASAERTTEQIRATTRNFMAINGLHARDLSKRMRLALGIGRMGDDWKGR